MEAASAGPVLGPFYTHDGDPSLVDATQWPRVPDYTTGDGRPLYRFAGDTPGGAPTGDGAGGVWHVYSGPVDAPTPAAANAASPAAQGDQGTAPAAAPPVPASATAAPGSPATASANAGTPSASPEIDTVQAALAGLLRSLGSLAEAVTDLVRQEADSSRGQ